MKIITLMLSGACAVCLMLPVCAPQPQRISRIIPLTENILTSVTGTGRSGSLARDGIEVSIDPLTRDALQAYNLILKPVRAADIDTLFRQGYINYTDDVNRELHEAYGLSGRYPYRGGYDQFGREMSADGWRVNPYLNAEGGILAFRIRIENRSPGKIAVRPSGCVLLNGRGNRQQVLRHDDWRGFAPLAFSPDHLVITCGRSGGVTEYFIPRKASAENGPVLPEKTFIYPGVRMEGLVVFPMVGDAVREFSVELPDVEFYDEENAVMRKRDFIYRFMVAETFKR